MWRWASVCVGWRIRCDAVLKAGDVASMLHQCCPPPQHHRTNGAALWPATRRVMGLGRPSWLVAPSIPAPPARALLRLVPLSPLLCLSHNVFLGLLLPDYDAWWCGPDTWAYPRQLAAGRGESTRQAAICTHFYFSCGPLKYSRVIQNARRGRTAARALKEAVLP